MQKNGVSSEIYSLINNEEVRPSTNLVVSKCSAYDYLNNSNPNIEKLTTKYYDTFSITSRFTGYISNITIGDFYNDLSAETCASTAILGGLNSTAREESSDNSDSSSSKEESSSSSETSNSNNSNQNSETQQDVITNPEDLTAGTSSVTGKRSIENFGIAVFNEDKLRGELTAVESICHLLITNGIDACIVSIDNPMLEDKKMELQLFPTKDSKISVDIKDDTPHISVKIYLNADIMTLEDNMDYESNETLEKISSSTKEYMESQLDDYLNKVSKEYSTDIDHFCTKAFSHFATISEWKEFNWCEKFKNAKFDVNVDVNVVSSLLITKT